MNDLNYINKEPNFSVTSNLCAFNSDVLSADVGSYTVKKTSKKSCKILQTSKTPTAMIKELAAVFLTVYLDAQH